MKLIELNTAAKKKAQENEELRRWITENWLIITVELTEEDIISIADNESMPVVIRNLARQHLGFLDIGQDG